MQKIAMVVLTTMMLTGCASVMKDDDSSVLFTSEPSGASILFGEVYQCDTPCSVRVDRFEDLAVTFANGNDLRTVKLGTGVQDDFAQHMMGNILLTGGFGILVDLLTRKNIGPKTDHLHVTF